MNSIHSCSLALAGVLLLGSTASSQIAAAPAAPSGTRAPGSLTTFFASDIGYGGNMFDITPAADLEITGMDINASAAGTTVDVNVWYRVGTAVGYENTALGWILFRTGSGTGMGTDNPTFLDLAGNGVVFQANQIYGLFVELLNVTATNTIRYTNSGPATYSNAQLSLTTHAGKGSGGFGGFTFIPREWNGTIYYDDAPGSAGPVLSVTNLVAGGTAQVKLANSAPGNSLLAGYSTTGAGPIQSAYGPVHLSQPYKTLPPLNAGAQGEGNWNVAVPAGATGVPVWMHAIDLTSGRLSNALSLVVG